MKILVIGGGISSEREVSLRSSISVAESLKASGHIVTYYDWDGTSQWLADNASAHDVVFPVLHGQGGEDGQIQKILEDLDCKYVGTDSIHSQFCMDKTVTRNMLLAEGIKLPVGQKVDEKQYKEHKLFSEPHVLKPKDGGSSIDTFIFSDIAERDQNKVHAAFRTHKTMLIEQYIVGKEITVPVMQGKDLPVIEIIPPTDGTFDYQNKYNGLSKELCPPENVSQEVQKQATEIALKCHKVMGCRHLSRTDMIVSADGIFVLEVNTMPGMTGQSLFPKAAQYAGLNMNLLTDYLVKLAVKD